MKAVSELNIGGPGTLLLLSKHSHLSVTVSILDPFCQSLEKNSN